MQCANIYVAPAYSLSQQVINVYIVTTYTGTTYILSQCTLSQHIRYTNVFCGRFKMWTFPHRKLRKHSNMERFIGLVWARQVRHVALALAEVPRNC